MVSNYLVRLESFEGPLDLLLHLIKVHELDIFAIDLNLLTRQYLEHLRLIEFADLKDAAAFLHMASSLIQIKSRELLPADERASAQDGEGEDELTLDQLQARLLQYEQFQRAALFLSEQSAGNELNIASEAEYQRLAKLYEGAGEAITGDKDVLLILYEQLLSAIAERNPPAMGASGERLSISEVMKRLNEKVEKLRFFMLQSLFPSMDTRYDLVIHILAILQLTREGQLDLFQESDFSPLWVAEKDVPLEELSQKAATVSAGLSETTTRESGV